MSSREKSLTLNGDNLGSDAAVAAQQAVASFTDKVAGALSISRELNFRYETGGDSEAAGHRRHGASSIGVEESTNTDRWQGFVASGCPPREQVTQRPHFPTRGEEMTDDVRTQRRDKELVIAHQSGIRSHQSPGETKGRGRSRTQATAHNEQTVVETNSLDAFCALRQLTEHFTQVAMLQRDAAILSMEAGSTREVSLGQDETPARLAAASARLQARIVGLVRRVIQTVTKHCVIVPPQRETFCKATRCHRPFMSENVGQNRCTSNDARDIKTVAGEQRKIAAKMIQTFCRRQRRPEPQHSTRSSGELGNWLREAVLLLGREVEFFARGALTVVGGKSGELQREALSRVPYAKDSIETPCNLDESMPVACGADANVHSEETSASASSEQKDVNGGVQVIAQNDKRSATTLTVRLAKASSLYTILAPCALTQEDDGRGLACASARMYEDTTRLSQSNTIFGLRASDICTVFASISTSTSGLCGTSSSATRNAWVDTPKARRRPLGSASYPMILRERLRKKGDDATRVSLFQPCDSCLPEYAQSHRQGPDNPVARHRVSSAGRKRRRFVVPVSIVRMPSLWRQLEALRLARRRMFRGAVDAVRLRQSRRQLQVGTALKALMRLRQTLDTRDSTARETRCVDAKDAQALVGRMGRLVIPYLQVRLVLRTGHTCSMTRLSLVADIPNPKRCAH